MKDEQTTQVAFPAHVCEGVLMHRKLRQLLAAVLLPPILVTAAGSQGATGQAPEHPTSVTLLDARGDVYKFRGPEHEAAPRNHRADIARVRVRHNHEKVVVRTGLFRLRREGVIYGSTRLRTDEGKRRVILLGAESPHWSGWVQVNAGTNGISSCATSHNIDYANNKMTVRVARSCLSNPRWVRARVTAAWHPAQHRHFVLGDSAHTDSFRQGGFTRRLYRAS
jgi:hypothetical protein